MKLKRLATGKFTVFLLCFIFLAGCVRQFEDDYSYIDDENLSQFDAAKKWYEEQTRGKEVLLNAGRKINGKKQLFYTEPSWKYCLETRKENFHFLEVDLTDRIALDFVTPENAERYIKTQETKYKRSVTRLVIETNGKGERVGFLMTVIPSAWYSKYFGHQIHKNTYLKRDYYFVGMIVFHNLDGEFVNGWKYVQGKIVASLKEVPKGTGGADAVSLVPVSARYEVKQRPATRFGYEPIELEPVIIVGNGKGYCWECGFVFGGISSGYIYDYEPDYGGAGYGGDGGYGGYNGGAYPGDSDPVITEPVITLIAENNTVDLMARIKIYITLENLWGNIELLQTNDYQLIISRGGGSWGLQSNGSSCDFIARCAGKWEIHANLLFNDQLVTSNTITVTVNYPSRATILSNMENAMQTCWQDTKNTASPSKRQERGFWIYLDTSTGNYSAGSTILGDEIPGDDCIDTHGSITLGAAREQRISLDPLEGSKYAVAAFHTHTPLTYCTGDGFRPTGPSIADYSYGNSNNIPCFIYDYMGSYSRKYNSVGVITGHPIDVDDGILYDTGPERIPVLF